MLPRRPALSARLNALALFTIIGAGALLAAIAPARAEQVFTRCNEDGTYCEQAMCDEDGEDCRPLARGRPHHVYAEREHPRPVLVCDAEGRDCRWAYPARQAPCPADHRPTYHAGYDEDLIPGLIQGLSLAFHWQN